MPRMEASTNMRLTSYSRSLEDQIKVYRPWSDGGSESHSRSRGTKGRREGDKGVGTHSDKLSERVPTPLSYDPSFVHRMRWYAELDLRSLKQTMQMDILRCQSPEMGQKEVWAHLLAYNLLRGQMARATEEGGLLPLQVSFKGALQVVSAFAAVLWTADVEGIAAIMGRLRAAIRSHRVGNRANRCEPRARKRRAKHYPFLNESRQAARSRSRAKCCA